MKNKSVIIKYSFLIFSFSLVNYSVGQTLNPSTNVETVFEQKHSNLNGMVSEFVRKMYQDKSGNYWFGTNGDWVIRYNGEELEQFTDRDQFGGTAVRGIVEDDKGNVKGFAGVSDEDEI